MKLALFTRKFSRYENPFVYRLIRGVLKRVYPIKPPRSALRTVISYEEGLINVDTSSLGDYKILFHNRCEPAVTNVIKKVVRPGDLCLDIGANVGAITLVMAFATGREGKVIAVEPHPVMVERLKANLELNGLDNVSIMPVAVSDTPGMTTLYAAQESDYNQGRASLRPSEGIPDEIPVEKITGNVLEEEFQSLRCRFIKIDVEGHDFIVLKELKDIIADHRPFIVFEYQSTRWREHNSDIHEAVELLSSLDYRIYLIKQDIVFPFERMIPDSCDFFCVPKQA